MKTNRTKTAFVSYEIRQLTSPVNTPPSCVNQTGTSHKSKMAELACKLAEDDISKLIQEARQLANSNKDKTHPCIQQAFNKMPSKS